MLIRDVVLGLVLAFGVAGSPASLAQSAKPARGKQRLNRLLRSSCTSAHNWRLVSSRSVTLKL